MSVSTGSHMPVLRSDPSLVAAGCTVGAVGLVERLDSSYDLGAEVWARIVPFLFRTKSFCEP